MKKNIFRFGMLALLFVLLFTIASCDEEDAKIEDDLEYIIQDEITWNEAFEKLDFVNFSTKFVQEYLVEGEEHKEESILYVTETCAYHPFNDLLIRDTDGSFSHLFSEFYYIRTEENTYDDYYRFIEKHGDFYVVAGKFYSTFEEAKKNCLWNKRNDGESYSDMVKNACIQISFSEQFKSFIYNEENHTYSYDGTLVGKIYNRTENGNKIYEDINCVNPSVQFQSGKIISLTTELEPIDEIIPDGCKVIMSYFDIGTTKVTVPQEVIEMQNH